MNTPTLPVLSGTAVTLRPITDADTDLIVKWRNTPSVVQILQLIEKLTGRC